MPLGTFVLQPTSSVHTVLDSIVIITFKEIKMEQLLNKRLTTRNDLYNKGNLNGIYFF